jgi:hypothetical protein
MDRQNVDTVMQNAGFTVSPPSFGGTSFDLAYQVGWKLHAYASGGSQLAYERIDIGVVPTNVQHPSMKGMQYRVLSETALVKHLPAIMNDLPIQARDDARMKCPTVGLIHTAVSEPDSCIAAWRRHLELHLVVVNVRVNVDVEA